MTTKAIPLGRCADCRWAEDLPNEMAQDEWCMECMAMPRDWKCQVERQKTVDPKTREPMVVRYIVRAAAYKRKDDFCQFWAPRPVGTDMPQGGLLGGTDG